MYFIIFNSIREGTPINPWIVVMRVLAALTCIFLVMPFHDFLQAFVALKLGDKTPKEKKRLTMNPIRSLSVTGMLFCLLFDLGWTKSMPVKPWHFKREKGDMALTVLSGSLANIIAILVSSLGLNLVMMFNDLYFKFDAGSFLGFYTVLPDGQMTSLQNLPQQYICVFFLYMMSINFLIMVANLLIAIPPFDGYKLAKLYLPDWLISFLRKCGKYFAGVLFVVMATVVFHDVYEKGLGYASYYAIKLMRYPLDFIKNII